MLRENSVEVQMQHKINTVVLSEGKKTEIGQQRKKQESFEYLSNKVIAGLRLSVLWKVSRISDFANFSESQKIQMLNIAIRNAINSSMIGEEAPKTSLLAERFSNRGRRWEY